MNRQQRELKRKRARHHSSRFDRRLKNMSHGVYWLDEDGCNAPMMAVLAKTCVDKKLVCEPSNLFDRRVARNARNRKLALLAVAIICALILWWVVWMI